MVKKSSKFEVHSGNSLKASNSKHIKLYCKQAFIVRQYDLNNSPVATSKDLDRQLCEWDVGHNDVTYSLNKKGRWELPCLLKKHIHSDDTSEQDVKISLLEHHKKRRANCVSYHANKGETTEITPRKGYFDKGSIHGNPRRPRVQRARRRGNIPQPEAEPQEEAEPERPEPEIIYDVFYPCHKTSSLIHNPKYICRPVVTDNGQAKRSANRRAKLTTSAYLDICDEEQNLDEMFDDVDVVEDVNSANDSDIISPDEISGSSFSLEGLLDRALKARDLCDIKKSSIVPKAVSQEGKADKQDCDGQNQKACVVYLDEELPAEFYPKQMKKKPSPVDHPSESKEPANSTPVTKTMPSCRILLSSDSVTEDNLRKQFSDKYFEASCHPRKFAVDITNQVTEICRKRKLVLLRQEPWSWLIFTHEGIYDNEMQVFRVHLNSELGFEQLAIETLFEMNIYTMEEVCQSVGMFVESCSEESIQKLPAVMCATLNRPVLTFDLLKSLKGWDRQTYHSSQAYKTTLEDSMQKLVETQAESPHLENSPEFCNICFTMIDSTIHDSDQATSLKSCDHWFCNNCWREHFQSSINRGVLCLQCPEFDCKSQVDHITALSVISASEYKKYLHHCHDNKVQLEMETTKWCPNPKCGRVLTALTTDKPSNDSSMCVTCDCGTSVCFQCLAEAHWPATCQQARDHRRRVKDLGDSDSYLFLNEDTTFVVDVKYCPSCRQPINKNGGCPYMECRCGFAFCWSCLVRWPHHTACKNEGKPDKHGTLKRVLRHEDRFRNRPKYYMMSLTHRYYRQPRKLKEFRKKEKAIKGALKKWGMHHFSDLASILPVSSLQDGDLVALKTAVDEFIGQMTNLNIELHFIIENTAVILQEGDVNEGSKLITHIIDRMEFIANRIEQIFEEAGCVNYKYSLLRLKELQTCARRCLVSLISSIATIQV